MNQIFLLDFDRTLINSPKLREHLWRFLERFDIPIDVSQATYKILIDKEDQHYSLQEHLICIASTLSKELHIEDIVYAFENEFARLEDYIYPDVLPWLVHAHNMEHQLYLVTRGDEQWQSFKLRASGIDQYFDKIFYSLKRGKKIQTVAQLLPDHHGVALVDDSIFELDQARLCAPHIRTFYIRRFEDQPLLDASSPHTMIESFVDLHF